MSAHPQTVPDRPVRRRLAGLFLGLVVALGATLAAVPIAAPADAVTPTELTRTVTYNGRTVTVRLHPVTLRAPGFEVLVQQADGSLVRQTDIHAESGWLGGVDGDPSAVASGIIRADGRFEGSVVFDRGATWRLRDVDTAGTATVHSTRGLTPPTAYKWPSASDVARNVSTAPGQAGTTTYRWDIGFDLTNNWFADPQNNKGSIDNAIDMIDLDVVSMMHVYETNALLRPAVGRVIIRAAASQDPYAAYTTHGQFLGAVRSEWQQRQADANVDNIALFNGLDSGGGLAYVGTAGTSGVGASNGGNGDPINVLRHELGHNWGAHDNHTNGPEGSTIESGNQYDRFDGTELSAIFRYRDSRQASSAPFTAEGVFAEPLPPYAALDLVDDQMSTVAYRFRPTANDHDANADTLTLASVQSTSRLGGSLTMAGDVVTYTPPSVSTADTLDSVEYVVRDASGRTATGVALFRVDPYVAMPASTTWPAAQVPTNSVVEIRNQESGLYASVPPDAVAGSRPVQGTKGTTAAQRQLAQWRLIPSGAGYQLQNVATGLCIDTPSYLSTLDTCVNHARQQWKAVQHPRGGTSFLDGRWSKCLKPYNGGIDSGVVLGYAICSQQLSNVWSVSAPPIAEWPAAPVPAVGPQRLVNVGSGLVAGLPVGSTAWTDLVLRADGVGATFRIEGYGDGTWKIVEAGTGACADDYGSTVGTWGCHGGSNQHWTLLENPAGGVSIVGLRSGKCLATAGDATAAGTKLAVTVCSTSSATQRWQLGA